MAHRNKKNQFNVAETDVYATADADADSGARRGSRRKFVRGALALLAVAAVCAAVVIWALPHLPEQPSQQQQAYYRGVLEMWNVECFEGGVGSREAWLTSRSAQFEQHNKGLFVHVTTLTVEQMAYKLQKGDAFDLICFSRGAGALVKDKLAVLNIDLGGVMDNFAVSAQFDGKQYAAPLYAGAYCLFARAEQLPADKLLSDALTAVYTRKIGKNTVDLQPLICGFTAYNSPLSALAMSGGKGKAQVSQDVTQYAAYEQFVGNKTAVTLLGTQRDMFRLEQRENNAKIEQLAFVPLGGYTDLVQYVGISAQAQDKMSACESYIEHLLSSQTQQTLVNLRLFSVCETNLYTLPRYSACESLLPTAYVPSVFGDETAIANQRKAALDTLSM